MSHSWTPEHAERHLRSLELFGMRFGLDRMRRMMTALGSPERSFDSIHVVGTNGKTSTTRMISAILERHGLRTGCFTSPHLVSYAERVQVSERDTETHAFAAAIAHAALAAERVNRTLDEDDHVTQFELLTAAAFWELCRREVGVAVVEAGLGGRYDATNVIDAKVAVLTNVGLEHTRWLGPTVADIAGEKLEVLAQGATLVLGAGLSPEVRELAQEIAARRGAQVLALRDPRAIDAASVVDSSTATHAHPAADRLSLGVEGRGVDAGSVCPAADLRAAGSFQRTNFELAKLAARAYLDLRDVALDRQAVRAAAASVTVPGRAQTVSSEPLTVLDGAHNPDAVAALVQALPELTQGRPLALVLGVLEDKDATAMLRSLLACCRRAWFTAPPSARALPPATLQSLARQLGYSETACEPQPLRALAHAQEWARARDGRGAVLVTGSVYLVGDMLAHASQLGWSTTAQPGAARSRAAALAIEGART
jgi:dihydrofolate synthase / folylpolyglutamate synthase